MEKTEWMNVKKVRSSNLELFRIISMLLIIAHHYVVNSGLTAPNGPIYAHTLSKSSLFYWFLAHMEKWGLIAFCLLRDILCVNQIYR